MIAEQVDTSISYGKMGRLKDTYNFSFSEQMYTGME